MKYFMGTIRQFPELNRKLWLLIHKNPTTQLKFYTSINFANRSHPRPKAYVKCHMETLKVRDGKRSLLHRHVEIKTKRPDCGFKKPSLGWMANKWWHQTVEIQMRCFVTRWGGFYPWGIHPHMFASGEDRYFQIERTFSSQQSSRFHLD
jgi:hypothetical protein